jgi:hypothetical protein
MSKEVVTKQKQEYLCLSGILFHTMIGAASSFAGLLHTQERTCLVGVSVAGIACMLDLLGAGYAIKQRKLEDEGTIKGDLSGRDQFFRCIAIIQVISQIIYVGALFCTPVEPRDNAVIQAISQVFYLGAIFGLPVEPRDNEAEETITTDLEENTKRDDEMTLDPFA